MKKLDSNPAKPVAFPTAKSKDDKTDLDADCTATRSSGMNPVPTSVSEAALKEAHNDLELKVRERTAQLEATVAALENEMQARNALENQLRQWSRVFMDAADPIVIENLTGTIIDMNRRGGKRIRMEAHELIGKSIRSLIPPRPVCMGGSPARALPQRRGSAQPGGYAPGPEGPDFFGLC